MNSVAQIDHTFNNDNLETNPVPSDLEAQNKLTSRREMVVIIRTSFVKLFNDPCKAALFDHILYQIAKKSKGQPREAIQEGKFTYYKTNEELTELTLKTWGVCKVRKAVNDLIKLGLLGRTKSPWGADRTKHFYFGQEQCRKLIELCHKNNICLHTIGLAPEVMQLLFLSFATDEIIKCSCGQTIDLSNRNDKNIQAITTNTTKIPSLNKDNYERMNSARVQNKVENFHPSILPSVSQNSSSGEKGNTQEKEVVFTELEEQVYQIAKDLKLARLRKNEKNKAYCAQLVEKDVLTHEKMKRLMGYSRKRLNKGPEAELYLGNLVRDLDGWLQVEEAKHLASTDIFGNKPCSEENTTVDITEEDAEMVDTTDLPPVTNEEIADKIRYFSQSYHDEIHADDNVLRAEQIRLSFGISREMLYDALFYAQSNTDSTSHNMTDFFECLEWCLQAS